jgi:serine/threonine protein kinase
MKKLSPRSIKKYEKLLTAEEIDNLSDIQLENLIKQDPLCKGDRAALYKRFHFIKSIGSGGFGEVYLVYDRVRKCFVAIKSMPIDIKNFTKYKKDIIREL